MNNYYALIMAGGGGTRLWPLSRKDLPKQSIALVGEETTFRRSVQRILPVFSPERIFIITGKNHVEKLRQDVPELPAENFILEPFGMDSGPAAGLGTAYIAAKDPNATVAVLASDHHITDEAGFCQALQAAYRAAQENYIVTLGIAPSFPATSYGYIHRGDALGEIDGLKIYQSLGFREKPNQETAIEFILSGDYSWNSGMFIWKADRLLGEFARQRPRTYQNLAVIQQTVGTPEYSTTLENLWAHMEKLSVDYAIMEKAEQVAVIPVSIGWSDIGSWSSLYDLLADGKDNINITKGRKCELVALDTDGTLVISEKVVVTIGLHDMVIVDMPDVLLICPRERDQEVRAAVQRLRDEGNVGLL